MFKGAKNVLITGVDDKRHLTATFAVSLNETFLPIQGNDLQGKNQVFPTKV